MEQNKPLISIFLPVYNKETYLSTCLESLLSQSYEQIEIIAIDDHSTDTSLAILKEYKKRDKRLRVYHNVKRYGLTITLNRCVKKARGKYIAFLNPQDIATKDRLKRQLNYLLSHPKTVAVGTQCLLIDEKRIVRGKSEYPFEHEEITKSLILGTTFAFETALINTYLLPKDVLYFHKHRYPFIYAALLVKLLAYGKFATPPFNLSYCMEQQHNYLTRMKKQLLPHIALWVKARFLYDHQPSLQTLLS